MARPAQGDTAPDFTLPGNGGSTITLSAHRGKTVILYFYPKDATPGCTLEAQDFSARAKDFAAAGAVIIGVSPDSAKKHDNFCKKFDLNLLLAADTETSVAQAYGVWVEKQMYGKKYMGIERTTFLIRPDGTIGHVWEKVSVDGHAQDVLETVTKG